MHSISVDRRMMSTPGRARGISLHASSTVRESLVVIFLLIISSSLPVAYFESDHGASWEKDDVALIIDGKSTSRRGKITVL